MRSCEFCSVTGGGGGKHTWEAMGRSAVSRVVVVGSGHGWWWEAVMGGGGKHSSVLCVRRCLWLEMSCTLFNHFLFVVYQIGVRIC